MAYVERDAKRRTEAKKNEIKRSDYLKTMGNGEYRKGNYEKALVYYNQVRTLIYYSFVFTATDEYG